MPIVISTNSSLRNAPFIYGDDAGGPLGVSYSKLIPNLNVAPASLLTAQNGALANNGEITVSFGTDQQNVAVAVSINMTGVLGRGLFRVRARKTTSPNEQAFFLLNGEISTVILYWTGGFETFGLQNLSQVAVAAYLIAAPNAPLIGSPL